MVAEVLPNFHKQKRRKEGEKTLRKRRGPKYSMRTQESTEQTQDVCALRVNSPPDQKVWGRLVPQGLPVGPHGPDPSKGPARCDHPSFMRRLTPLALTQWPWCQGPPSSGNDMGFSSMSPPGKQQWRGQQAATRAAVGLPGRVTPKGSAKTTLEGSRLAESCSLPGLPCQSPWSRRRASRPGPVGSSLHQPSRQHHLHTLICSPAQPR